MPFARARAAATAYDFLGTYVDDLPQVLDLDAIREAGVRIGADPLGGAAVDYWGEIADRHRLDLTVVNPLVDPTWRFMTLDWDGKIRMDCSSPYAMASLIERKDDYDIATGNDADADRHGIVTPDGGLMNPNHFLAVAIGYLFGGARPGWPDTARIGKTLVSSSMIDRVAASLGKPLVEVPVGFKWFVPGLIDGSFGFGGEESAGASFLRTDGTTWTTDKDGLILALLASEIQGRTGRSPSEHYADLVAQHGDPAYARIDAPADRDQKAKLARALPRRRHRDLAGRRGDHRQAHRGARQRREDRRAQGDHRVGVVRRPPLGHRGRLQDLRRVLPRPRPPRRGAGRGPRGGHRRARLSRDTMASRLSHAPRRAGVRVARPVAGRGDAGRGRAGRRWRPRRSPTGRALVGTQRRQRAQDGPVADAGRGVEVDHGAARDRAGHAQHRVADRDVPAHPGVLEPAYVGLDDEVARKRAGSSGAPGQPCRQAASDARGHQAHARSVDRRRPPRRDAPAAPARPRWAAASAACGPSSSRSATGRPQ